MRGLEIRCQFATQMAIHTTMQQLRVKPLSDSISELSDTQHDILENAWDLGYSEFQASHHLGQTTPPVLFLDEPMLLEAWLNGAGAASNWKVAA